jgi:ketosteroid isomerase-like protein
MTHADLARFLEGFWGRFVEAESSGDFAGVADLCAADLVFQSPAEEPYETLQSLMDAWWTPPADYRIEFDHAELVVDSDLAIQRGVASDSFTNQAGEATGHRYNYLAVFGRRDGAWKLTHFISNAIS